MTIQTGDKITIRGGVSTKSSTLTPGNTLKQSNFSSHSATIATGDRITTSQYGPGNCFAHKSGEDTFDTPGTLQYIFYGGGGQVLYSFEHRLDDGDHRFFIRKRNSSTYATTEYIEVTENYQFSYIGEKIGGDKDIIYTSQVGAGQTDFERRHPDGSIIDTSSPGYTASAIMGDSTSCKLHIGTGIYSPAGNKLFDVPIDWPFAGSYNTMSVGGDSNILYVVLMSIRNPSGYGQKIVINKYTWPYLTLVKQTYWDWNYNMKNYVVLAASLDYLFIEYTQVEESLDMYVHRAIFSPTSLLPLYDVVPKVLDTYAATHPGIWGE